jgi:hypothetical protein
MRLVLLSQSFQCVPESLSTPKYHFPKIYVTTECVIMSSNPGGNFMYHLV